MLILLTVAFLTGTIVPVQTAANARLRLATGSLPAVVLISFAVSFAALLFISLACGIAVLPTAAQAQAIPWWGWLGGIIALFTISASTFLFKTLGQLQTTILPLLGQLLFSLVIDNFGLFGSVQIPFSTTRAAAIALILFGIALAIVLPNLKQRQQSPTPHRLLWQIAAVAAGCLMASIGAIYGTLGTLLQSAVQASTISFGIAVVAMFACCLVTGSTSNAKAAFNRKQPWWSWLGGICGAISVFSNAFLIPLLGAGTFFTAMLLGQILLSIVLETRGWLGAPQKPVLPGQYAGLALMLAGVALIRL